MASPAHYETIATHVHEWIPVHEWIREQVDLGFDEELLLIDVARMPQMQVSDNECCIYVHRRTLFTIILD